MNLSFALLSFLLIALVGCRSEAPDRPAPPTPPERASSPGGTAPPAPVGCLGCHPSMTPDAAHDLGCTTCHAGTDQEADQDKAHAGLISRPAHPEHMAQTCGRCHPRQVSDARHSLHFTLANKTNVIRRHFGAAKALPSATAIAVVEPPDSPLALADDMLRRRCLRCHVFSRGDDYPARTHGAGCAACHLPFASGAPDGHRFTAPADQQCLSCHTSNFVGSDYHGRFEHDYRWEYRTPYTPLTADNTPPRPYGLEFHDLAPDIHQQRGLICIDCHRNSGHIPADPISCASCHAWKSGQPLPPLRVQAVAGSLRLTGQASGATHAVPPLRHPAHAQYGRQVACQVCHGQWSVNDAPTHLLLSFDDDCDPWAQLTVQGSSEVESLLEHNLYYSENRPLTMRDGLTGAARDGIWYQGFGQRRWEEIPIQRDTDGVIKVFRPILDLRLSMVRADGAVPFNNLTGQTPPLRPYTPHTTGHAGVFYLDRFRHLLPPNPR